MNAEEFLKTKGIGKPTIKAVRLAHKYKNIELELIPLMEEYAELKLLSTPDVVGQSERLVCPNCDGEGFSGKGTTEILPCLSCFGSGEKAN